jgi:ribosome maturation factor RimP
LSSFKGGLLVSEIVLGEILLEILQKPIELFSSKVTTKNGHSLIEINLDNLNNPYGSVTLDQCELVSNQVILAIETRFPELDYTLQVSSAGAERILRLPEDLERFKTLPLRLYFNDEEGKLKNEVFKIINMDEVSLELQVYKGKKAKKKMESLVLAKKNLVKGNLFLDF